MLCNLYLFFLSRISHTCIFSPCPVYVCLARFRLSSAVLIVACRQSGQCRGIELAAVITRHSLETEVTLHARTTTCSSLVPGNESSPAGFRLFPAWPTVAALMPRNPLSGRQLDSARRVSSLLLGRRLSSGTA